MRLYARFTLAALAGCVLLLAALPAAAQASFGVEKFFAGNCSVGHESCGEGANDPSEATAITEGYRQAGGHVPFGVTDFVLNTFKEVGPLKATVPQASVKYLRTDVAPGVVTNPQAVPKCAMSDFEGKFEEPAAGVAGYSVPTCPTSSIIGLNTAETAVEVAAGVIKDYKLQGKVYNLEPPSGLGSDFGVALDLEPIFGIPLYAHTFIEGNVEWASDYHDYFEIKNITPGLISSRLVFYGAEAGTSGFLRNPTACSKPGPETTTTLTVESYEGQRESKPYELPVGTTGCETELFTPSFSLLPETAFSDQPDGVTAEVTQSHPAKASETDHSDLRTASITLPEGLTMNPSAAAGLEGCTPEQIGIGTRNPTACPSKSQIGTVSLEVPTLPAGALQGPIYLGKPAGKSIEGPPYTIYLDAESARFGVKVRLKGTVEPNLTTGRLTTTFTENPQAPFNSVILHFSGGAFAPLANPLTCGTGAALTSFTPFSGTPAVSSELPFEIGGCAASGPPFAPAQSTSALPASGAANTNFSFQLTRPEGQQYVEQIRTVLPSGLAGKIPTVPLCAEAQANAGTCSAASLLGTVTVTAGSGEPYTFTGNVYLTGPYNGAPYGLSFVVPVVAGPFNLGTEVKRAKIEVEPYSSRVIVTSTLPTIRDGIPVRLRSINVSVTRANFMVNPTNCAAEQTESTVKSTFGTEVAISSPFQAEGCSSLAFTPSFSASTSGKPDKADGASLVTTITQGAGQANIKSVFVTLPLALPSRQTTLSKACLQATFEASPANCDVGSRVGTATAVTPLLPGTLKGTAYYISHGGEAFPDLDIVLEGDGVRTILIGKTKITKGITTTNFAANPDVPVSSFTLNLSMGPYSALAAPGGLCKPTLLMPTVITAQNGKQVKQNTVIKPSGCGVQIVGHKVVGATAYLTVKTFEAGRISGSGSGLRNTYRTLSSASKATTLKIPLSSGGLARRRPFKVRLRIGFKPKSKKAKVSQTYVTVRFG